MTYSIVGVDPERDEVGVAVQSKFLAAGAIVPWARGGVGAVAVQAFPDVTVGPRALDELAAGTEPEEILERLVRAAPLAAQRQVGIVAADGRSASHTGEECFDWRGSLTGPGFAAQGNVLAGEAVLAAMAVTFAGTGGALAGRLLAALQAAQDAGGELRGMEAAALIVCRPGGGYGGNHDRMVDLRVDHADDPIAALRQLLDVHTFHFGKSAPQDLVALDEDLGAEVARRLHAGGWLDDEHAPLERALQDFLGWENLEERWVDAQHMDPVALEHLRARLPDPRG